MQKQCIGKNGQITLENNRLDITRKGFVAFSLHGFDGTKSIFIKSITGIQFKEAGKLTNGFIQFVFPGSGESKKGLRDAVSDENTVTFDKSQEADFIELRNYLFDVIGKD